MPGSRRPAPPLRRLAMATQNALEIMRFGRLTAPYGAPFDVVTEDRVCRLRRYQGGPAAARPDAPALLLVPPLMVASEVYDISPDTSAVAALLAEGIDVWLTDFGAPEREEGGMQRTLDDHVRAVSSAIAHVRGARGRDVHLAGYSQGGMFAYQAAALRRGDGLASVITFGSPVDIHKNAPTLSDAVAERLIGALRGALALPLESNRGLPGFLTSTGFKLLSARKEVKQLAEFVAKLHDREALEKREAKRLFLRGQGFVAWPGPALKKFVDDMIVANRMLEGGFIIDGQPVTLADIRCPILCFVGLRDDMARPASVRAIKDAAPDAEVHEVGVKAGHFGLVVGSAALERTWPTVVEWLRWRDGAGPRPLALTPDERPVVEDADSAIDELGFDLELLSDVAYKAASALWHRVEDRARDLADSLDHLRYQVPRLEKLRALGPGSVVSVGRALAERAAETPDATFFLWRGRAFTCREADVRVNNVVRGLIACDVRPGHQVAVLMHGRPSFLTLVTALSRLGAIAVLLPPETADAALARALGRLECAAVVADPEHAARARALAAGAGGLPTLVLGGGGEARSLGDGLVDLEAVNPDAVKLPAWYAPDPGRAGELAMILVQAGSSAGGEPRLGRVTNERWAFSAYGAAASATLTPRDTVYSCLPLHHAAGSMVAAGGALVSGARLALAERFAPEEFWSEVRRYGATVVFYAGEMCRALVDAPHARGEHNHPVRLFAGSGMRADVWRRLGERFGRVGVLEFYASTETSAVMGNASGEKIGAVGRPLPGSSELAVVSYDVLAGTFARDGRGFCVRAPVDQPGMLLARLDTPGHAPLQRVLRGAFAAGDAWYVTGDLLRQDGDGDYWLVDRAAEMIRTSGGAVAPRAVEDALYAVPGVRLAVAYAVTTPEGEEVPGAAVALLPGKTIDPAALDAALAALPPHARPRFVRHEVDLPVNAGFRPLRGPLRALGWPAAGTPVFCYDAPRGRYAA